MIGPRERRHATRTRSSVTDAREVERSGYAAALQLAQRKGRPHANGSNAKPGGARRGLNTPQVCPLKQVTEMAFAVGTKVVLESELIQRPARTAIIEEVLEDDPAPRYRIRWDDGHESIHVPAAREIAASNPELAQSSAGDLDM